MNHVENIKEDQKLLSEEKTEVEKTEKHLVGFTEEEIHIIKLMSKVFVKHLIDKQI